MTEKLLELNGVCASYTTYRALFGVSFSVPEHGIVALLGSNGAGKSTVARVVSGLVPPTEGSVVFDGHDISHVPAYQIARMGLVHVPEGRGVFGTLTVDENLILTFRRTAGKGKVKEALERAYDAFPALSDRRRQVAGTLSGGQQRMLTLARALATPPRLLVVDELSLGLAPVIVDAVYDGLVKIREAGTSLLVVEQQIDRALSIADEAVLLVKGSVAWKGPAAGAAAAMEGLLTTASVSAVPSENLLVEALAPENKGAMETEQG
ncbi:MAG TPA: ABC transporter ATP-binding protein [Acidimicrobiales bacterium]|nr:ABC transporter ATP-binding protein [Acidimicrobiales bacterium]